MVQIIDVLFLKRVMAPSVEQTADVPIVEKDLADEREDAVVVVEEVVEVPGPLAKLTLAVFVSQYREEFSRTGSM